MDLVAIMKASADLGHYVGDAHVPLHTTENYNGQMTGQKGIHGLWESRLPELFGVEYDFFVGKAYYVEDLFGESWKFVLESHVLVDSVLKLEKELTDFFPSDKKYGYESRNNIVVRTYSREFADAYHKAMEGMVEKRMRESVLRVGSYWYTAWKLAGSPDLSPLMAQSIYQKPPSYKKLFNILDREAFDVGHLFDNCCCKPKQRARAFGLARTMSCVQDDPRWGLYMDELSSQTPPKSKSARKWYQKLWTWIKWW